MELKIVSGSHTYVLALLSTTLKNLKGKCYGMSYKYKALQDSLLYNTCHNHPAYSRLLDSCSTCLSLFAYTFANFKMDIFAYKAKIEDLFLYSSALPVHNTWFTDGDATITAHGVNLGPEMERDSEPVPAMWGRGNYQSPSSLPEIKLSPRVPQTDTHSQLDSYLNFLTSHT